MKKHTFTVENNVYELEEVTDIFGCSCVSIRENGVFRGCIDIANASDFLKIEHYIVTDPDYIDSCDVYC